VGLVVVVVVVWQGGGDTLSPMQERPVRHDWGGGDCWWAMWVSQAAQHGGYPTDRQLYKSCWPHKLTALSSCVVCACCCVSADTPNEATGWSPERAKAFGATHVTALLHTVPTLLKDRLTKEQ
jgi:hypothetical protein